MSKPRRPAGDVSHGPGAGFHVLVCFTHLQAATRIRLDAHAPGWSGVQVDPADPEAYWRALSQAWQQPGDLVVIEQDIGIHSGVLEGFHACPKPWCGHPYNIGGHMLVCLGCTRFTAALKTAEPDLLEVVGDVADGGVPARHWRRLDVRIADELRRRGYAVHAHPGAVEHYHTY